MGGPALDDGLGMLEVGEEEAAVEQVCRWGGKGNAGDVMTGERDSGGSSLLGGGDEIWGEVQADDLLCLKCVGEQMCCVAWSTAQVYSEGGCFGVGKALLQKEAGRGCVDIGEHFKSLPGAIGVSEGVGYISSFKRVPL